MPLTYDYLIIAAFPLEASSDGELLQPPLLRPKPQCFNAIIENIATIALNLMRLPLSIEREPKV